MLTIYGAGYEAGFAGNEERYDACRRSAGPGLEGGRRHRPQRVFTNGEPASVFAQSLSLSGERSQSDNIAITIRLSNGSVGVITYLANGDSAFPKERIEIFSGGKTAIIDNFKVLETYQGGTRKVRETTSVEKGHKAEVEEFINSVHLAKDLIPFQSLVVTTRTTFKIIESLESGLPVEL